MSIVSVDLVQRIHRKSDRIALCITEKVTGNPQQNEWVGDFFPPKSNLAHILRFSVILNEFRLILSLLHFGSISPSFLCYS